MSAVLPAAPAKPADAVSLVGPKVLLMGPAGTGKTYALGTLADWAQANHKTMFVLALDPGIEALLGYWTDRKLLIPTCLHWHSQQTKPLTLKQIMDGAEKVGKLSYELLTKLQDPNRGDNNAFWKILSSCAEPVSDRDGRKFPPVDKWDSDMIFCIDGLTELSNAAMKMQIGNKPTAAPSDYGVAQNNLMNFLRLLTQGSRYTFVLIAHVQRSKNEVTGGETLQVNTVGQAICGEIPPMFSDVIYTVREGATFTWDTAAYGVDTKTRSLGYRRAIKPDFGQIMDLWKQRGGK